MLVFHESKISENASARVKWHPIIYNKCKKLFFIIYWIFFQNSERSEIVPPYFQKIQLSKTTYGRVVAFKYGKILNALMMQISNKECIFDTSK